MEALNVILADSRRLSSELPAALLLASPGGSPLAGLGLAALASAGLAGTGSSPGLGGGLLLDLNSFISSSDGLISSLLLWRTGGGDAAVGSEVGDSLIVSAPLPPLAEVQEAADVRLPVAAVVELLTAGPLGLVGGLIIHSVEVDVHSVSVLSATSSLHPPSSPEGSPPCSAPASAPWLGLSLRKEDGDQERQSDEKGDTELHFGEESGVELSVVEFSISW